MRFGAFFCYVLGCAVSVYAEKWEWGQELYLQGDMTNVRTKPSMDAPIAAQMPLGTKVLYGGSCENCNEQQRSNWSRIQNTLAMGAHTSGYSGWVHNTLLSKNKPTSTQMQKWKSKLDSAPIAPQAPKRKFIGVMHRMSKSDYFSLEAIAEYRNHTISLRPITDRPYSNWNNKLQRLHLYSKNQNIGTATTAGRFLCDVQSCPLDTIASSSANFKGTAIATNFPINTRNQRSEPTKQETQALKEFTIQWLPSQDGVIKRTVKKPDSHVFTVANTATNSKPVLISNWQFGYAGSHENDFAIIVLLERNAKGKYNKVFEISGYSGCHHPSYLTHLDIDEDGNDEIFVSCVGWEGYASFGIIQKKQGKWSITYGAEN